MNKIDVSRIKNNRLWKLMCSKGFSDCRKFSKVLIDKGFYTSFKHPANKANYGSKEEEQYKGNINSLARTITRTLYNNQFQNDDFLISCCHFFKCSADYLLDLIDLPTHAETDINKKTGLAKDSIDMLSKNKNSYFPFIVTTINFLLENDEHIEDKLKLLRLIQQYILLSQNIKSYDGCGVPRMEEKDIPLYDEYGTSMGLAPIDKMSNIFLLSINELLSKLKNNISAKQLRKIPDIFDILNDILSDLICMEEIRKNIDGFNFDIDNLYEINRRFKENEKRLVYLYGCNSINDIDFEIFKAKYPQYSDDKINFLKSQLNLE